MSSSSATPTDWPRDAKGPCLPSTGIEIAELTPTISIQSGGRKRRKNPDRIEAEACCSLFANPAGTALLGQGRPGESFSSGGMRAAALALSIRKARSADAGTCPPIVPLSFTWRSKNMNIRF